MVETNEDSLNELAKKHIPVNCVETDLQNVHGKHEWYHNLLVGLAS